MTRGEQGEVLAARLLEEKGYRILDRNFRTREGEIDLIAEDGQYIVFVEVKLRKNDRYGAAREYVTPAKQRRILAAAGGWLAEHADCVLQPRFDVIEIYEDAAAPAEICHLENAFEA